MNRLAIVFALICFPLAGISQQLPEDIFFEHMSLPGAIRSTQVTDIVQDKYGLIWIGGDGLFKYDGYRIINYKNIEGVGSIGGREVNALYFDEEKNRLLIGTHSFGLIEYSYRTDKLRKIPNAGQSPIISSIKKTTDGIIWVNSFSDGLHVVENDSIKKFSDPDNQLAMSTSIMTVGENLWIGRQRNIFILNGKKVVDRITLSTDNDLPDVTRITAMMVDSHGKAWLGTERSGVLVMDTSSRKIEKHFPPSSAPFFNKINAIYEDSNGLIWILAKSNGIAVYSGELDTFIHVTRNPLVPQTLSGDNCAALIEDAHGIIWVGATGDLNKYDPQKVRFKHINQNLLDSVSLSDNMVRGVFEDSFGTIWIGTDGGTLHRYDRSRNKMKKIPTRIPGFQQKFTPFYFVELDPQNLLIASSQGLVQFNRKSNTFNLYEPLRNLTKGHLVRQVLRSDQYLFLTISGDLVKHNLETGKYELFANFSSDLKTHVSNVTTIYIDSKQRLWLGVTGGISLYDPATDSFKHFQLHQPPANQSGSYFMILSIQEYEGKLWVGTFNSGIWIFDPENPGATTRRVINELSGLPNNTVYATIPDQGSNIWITTNRGLTKYVPGDSSFQTFSVNEGLQQEEFNRQSFFKCANGDIVIGGINGVNIFNPKDIAIHEDVYKPQLFGLNAFNTDKGIDEYVSLTDRQEVTLTSSQNYIDISFFVPTYREPRRFEVLHQLEGHDRDWIQTEVSSIRYSNIDPGSYRFKVKTISYTGVENTSEFTLIIKPPFWGTTWFIALSLLVVVILVVTIIQSYSRKAMNDKKRLESLLMERTREIVKSREDLANLNQKKDLIFSILSHDLRAPLTTLKGFLTVLIDASHIMTADELKKHATSIRNSVTSSLDLIDNTLFWSLSQTGNISYSPTAFSLNEMVTKLKELYQLTAEKKRINFHVNSNERINVYADENMIYVTLRNIVSNAIKFTTEGKSVTISISRNHQRAEIKVTDEGIGMSKAYIKKLFAEEHLQIKKGTSNEKGTGLGLVLCKKFIDMNRGSMSIHSEEEKGTEFTVQLPLAQG